MDHGFQVVAQNALASQHVHDKAHYPRLRVGIELRPAQGHGLLAFFLQVQPPGMGCWDVPGTESVLQARERARPSMPSMDLGPISVPSIDLGWPHRTRTLDRRLAWRKPAMGA